MEFIYLLILVFSTQLNMYNFPGHVAIRFLDIALIIVNILLIMKLLIGKTSGDKNIKTITFHKVFRLLDPWSYFMVFITIQFLIYSILGAFDNTTLSVFLRTFRLLFYMIQVTIVIKIIDIDIGHILFKVYRYYILITTFFLFIQMYLLRFHNFYLKGYLSFFPVARQELIDFSQAAWNSPFIRVRGVFDEPSHYAIVTSLFLAVSLFNDKKDKKKILINVFTTVGLLLSGSTLGMLMSIFLWGIWLLRLVFNRIVENFDSKNTKLIAILLVSLIIIIYMYFQTQTFHTIQDRFFRSLNDRVFSYIDIVEQFNSLPLTNKLFGLGMIDFKAINNVYYPSVLRILIFFGITGLLIFIWSLYAIFSNSTRNKRIFVLSIVLLSFFTELSISNFVLIAYPFLDNRLNNVFNCDEKVSLKVDL